MKTYISPLGFETTHVISLIVKHGIEKYDKIILLRPEASDTRADRAIKDIRDVVAKIDRTIIVEVVHVDHSDFGVMILLFVDLICEAAPPVMPEGKVIVNLSGGPREILVALTIASLPLSELIYITTSFSDIDFELREIELPHIARNLDEKMWQILDDLIKYEPTTLAEVATRLGVSGSTISRQLAKLAEMCAVKITSSGKSKLITITLSGRMLLKRLLHESSGLSQRGI